MTLFGKPSTRPLLVAAGLDPEVAILRVRWPDEDVGVWRAVAAISDRVRKAHGPDVHWGGWPAEPEVIAALQAALRDHAGTRRGQHIAWALIHYGLRDAETFAAAHPWDRLMFEWQARGLDATRVVGLVKAAGFEPLDSTRAIDGVDEWIDDPVRGMGCGWSLVGSLFEPCLTAMKLDLNCEPPGHAELLQSLAQLASPPVLVEASEDSPDGEVEWHVDYAAGGERSRFVCLMRDGQPDACGVLDEFDALMARQGRGERAFQFAIPREDAGAYVPIVVQDGARFAALDRVLGLPLEPRLAGSSSPR